MAINVYTNGRKSEAEAPTTIAELLAGKKLRPEVVTVYVNRAPVARDAYAVTALNDGDEVEIMLQMAGGR